MVVNTSDTKIEDLEFVIQWKSIKRCGVYFKQYETVMENAPECAQPRKHIPIVICVPLPGKTNK